MQKFARPVCIVDHTSLLAHLVKQLAARIGQRGRCAADGNDGLQLQAVKQKVMAANDAAVRQMIARPFQAMCNPESLESCNHSAGRVRSRTKAKRCTQWPIGSRPPKA